MNFLFSPVSPPSSPKLVWAADEDIPKWATLKLPNVKSVDLSDIAGDMIACPEWRRLDAFPGLRSLTIETDFDTEKLLDWPFRDLEELIVNGCGFFLAEEDFDRIRASIKQHDVRITLKPDPEMLKQMEGNEQTAEMALWRTVDPPATIIFEDE
jgi:hypothetical protein